LATSHVLSPNLFGSQAGPGYPLGGNLRAARRLAGAGSHDAVLAIAADVDGNVYDSALVGALRRQLAGIGIRIAVQPIPQTDFSEPAKLASELARADLVAVQRNASQTGDAVAYLRGLPYLPPAARARLARIDHLPFARR